MVEEYEENQEYFDALTCCYATLKNVEHILDNSPYISTDFDGVPMLEELRSEVKLVGEALKKIHSDDDFTEEYYFMIEECYNLCFRCATRVSNKFDPLKTLKEFVSDTEEGDNNGSNE